MTEVEKVLNNVDYVMLRKQKDAIVRRTFKINGKKGRITNDEIIERDYLDGLINFLDNIQDAVVMDEIRTEEQVFGKMGD